MITGNDNVDMLSNKKGDEIIGIKKYGSKYSINDVIIYCNLSKNPKAYISKIEPKTLHNNEYYITKTKLIEILTRTKNLTGKVLLQEKEV